MEFEEYSICNPWRRVGAYFIDSFIVSILALIITFISGNGSELMQLGNTYDIADLEALILSFSSLFTKLFIIQIMLGILYYGVFQGISNGQTLGKKLLSIKIIMVDGSTFTSLKSTLRFIINSILLNTCAPLGFIVFFTRYKQGIHDMIVKTVVIDEC